MDVQLFVALARAAETRVSDFKAQEIANASWVYATSGQMDNMQLGMALARAAERLVDDFNVQNLANMAWEYARAGRLDVQLFMALARVAARCVGAAKNSPMQKVVYAAQALATAGESEVQLLAALVLGD